MYDLGIVVGKFAPLTRGHITLINAAYTQSKRVLVILCHDPRWLEKQSSRDQKILTLKNRLRWLQNIFADTPDIKIVSVDESQFPEFPNGWQEFTSYVGQLAIDEIAGTGKKNTNISVAMFSSEISYDEKYKQHLGWMKHEIVDADRTMVPISATAIRNDLYKNWEYLPREVRKAYALRVVIIGVESCGKTNLVKMLSKHYNTSWVEEYGRTFCEKELHGNEMLLTSDDYNTIAFRHKELEAQAMETANKLAIIDTNAFVTEYYHRLYEGVANPIVTAIANHERYDLVIILEPTVPWVDDGLRVNSDRTKTRSLFETMLQEFPNQTPEGHTIRISSDSYKERFDLAVKAIDAFLSDVNKGEL